MTTNAGAIVVGIFDDRAQAEQAIDELLRAGFSNNQIRYSGQGAATGGVLASLKSFFTGQGTAAYDDLLSMGVPQEDARYYQSEYEAGRSIVAVLADGRMQEATAIMTRYGGYGANRRFAQTTDYSSGATADTAQTETEGAQRVQLREEQLEAGKQTVQTGEVGLRKEVVTEQKTMDVPVSREEVVIERRPGSGQPSDRPIGEGETYRVPVREEQVTVEKQPVVREEIGLGKRQKQETKQVSDTVQREEAHIERAGDANVQGSDVEERER